MSAAATILVTGSTGFVGRHLVAALRARGTELRIVGTQQGGEGQMDIGTLGVDQLLTLDVTVQQDVDHLVAETVPDVVIHLAALSHVQDAALAPRHTFAVNTIGTLNLADAVLRSAAESRFLYVGSAEAYGATLARWPVPVDEDAPLEPVNSYATSKAAADLMVGELAVRRGLQAVRFRPFNHTGPGQDARFVVPSFARQIARIEAGRQEAVLRVGTLTARRDMLDVRDVVNAYATAALMERPPAPGTIVNLASAGTSTIQSLLDRLLAMAIIPIGVEQDPALVRSPEQGYSGGDAGRAERLLFWNTNHSIEQTLRDVLDAFRAAEGVV